MKYLYLIIIIISLTGCKKKERQKFQIKFIATSVNDYISFETIHGGNGYGKDLKVTEYFYDYELESEITIYSAKYLLILDYKNSKLAEYNLDGHKKVINLNSIMR